MKTETWLYIAAGAVLVALWWKSSQAAAGSPRPVSPTAQGQVLRSLIPGVSSGDCSLPFVGNLLWCTEN